MRLDVTKRLVLGKKITVEGGECRWVNFKYERLPTFCYQCGLLSHALKDCPKNGDCNNRIESEELQYRAWMRGEIIRRYMQELTKSGMEKGAETGTSQWNSGIESERRLVPIRMHEASKGAGGAHESRLSSIEKIEKLHENGRVNGLVGK